MFDKKIQKMHFKDHVATFTDYGNIKILDFKAPNTNYYSIRFLFDEDYCKLHISGDLGSLTASNHNNMTYERFKDFINNPDYFEQKVICASRPFYKYDKDKAEKDLLDYIDSYDLYDKIFDYFGYNRSYSEDEETAKEFVNDEILTDFSDATGINSDGYSVFANNIDADFYEYVQTIGREKTNILDLYLLAFELAVENLEKTKNQ